MSGPKISGTRPKRRLRDGAGHLDPRHQRALLRASGPSGRKEASRAFLANAHSSDVLAEELGEEFVAAATSGEYESEDAMNQMVPEDIGGPFVTTGEDEDASDVSSPLDAPGRGKPRR
jgi:hypothetical protein